MLDTNICIFAIKHKPPALIRNFLQHDPDDLCISAITCAELMHGVEKSQSTAQNRAAITLFLSAMAILSFDDRAAEVFYGKTWAYRRGEVADAAQLAKLEKEMQGPELVVTVDLHLGTFAASIYTCDLSLDYVHINADYTT